MSQENIKRGYLLPSRLVALWENFHRPSKDYSPAVAGACLIWMALPSEVREKARLAACDEDVAMMIDRMKDELLLALLDHRITELLANSALNPREAAAISKLRPSLMSAEYRRRRQAELEAADDEAAAARAARALQRKARQRKKSKGA